MRDRIMNVENQTNLNEMPLVMKVEDLLPILHIGRNTAYELVRSGQIRCLRIGGRTIRIPRDAVLDFINGSKH